MVRTRFSFILATFLVVSVVSAYRSSVYAQAIDSNAVNAQRMVTADTFKRAVPIFSGVASLQQDTKERFVLVSGVSDARSGTALSKTTRFPICSLSKQFAAVSVIRLSDDGLVDLDAPLHSYVKGLEQLELGGQVCTVRHAMNHRCGLVRQISSGSSGHLTDAAVRAQYLGAISETELLHSPGSKLLYSNVGYDLLGLLVEDVSGIGYEAFLKSRFFSALNMANTGIETEVDTPGHARGLLWMKWFDLDVAQTLIHVPNYASTLGAAGNIYSTVDDLHRWNNALHSGQILSPAGYEALIKAPTVKRKQDEGKPAQTGGYAGGLINIEYDNETQLIWHNGALVPYMFSTFMGYVTQTKTSFVVLTNHATFISRLTGSSISLLEWLHGLGQVEDAPSLGWGAYLFPAIIGLFILVFPFLIFQYIRVLRNGHKKGARKALSALMSHTIYTPFFILMLWGTPTLGILIMSVFLALSVWGLWYSFGFFKGALNPLSFRSALKFLIMHLIVVVFVGTMDPLGSTLMGVAMTTLFAVYVYLERRDCPKSFGTSSVRAVCDEL
jgi:CubicO group peptidase (beta-lactamase class C family)